MALDRIVRSAVAIANRVTGSLQVDVTFEAWIDQDKYNKPTYATALLLPALVDLEQQMRHLPNGQDVQQQASIEFLVPVPHTAAEGRTNPIDLRDRITLPGGQTGPILDNGAGLVDPITNAPYLPKVVLGAVDTI